MTLKGVHYLTDIRQLVIMVTVGGHLYCDPHMCALPGRYKTACYNGNSRWTSLHYGSHRCALPGRYKT